MTISTTTLKNAARAIECDLWTDSDGCHYLAKDGAILRRWEPETSSADSFELMVALEIEVSYWAGFEEVRAEYHLGYVTMLNYTHDRAADTRWAILLCADKIGAAL
ncbi:hypothetical protein D3C71_277050 [compost metagenome]